MRTAKESKPYEPSRFGGAQQLQLPAPTGGINTRDPLAAMPQTDAIVMDNWYPRTGFIEVRGGKVDWGTVAQNAWSCVAYAPFLGGLDIKIAATNSGIYNTTISGAATLGIACTDGYMSYLQYGDGSNNWLLCCNGVDDTKYFNGAIWYNAGAPGAPSLTGVSSTLLWLPTNNKGRIFFAQKYTLKLWYLPAGVAGGALTAFDLAGVATKGGSILNMFSWTVDGGAGPDDRLVIITTKGEMIVYQGTNPGTASTWSLVGTYTIPTPVGYRCSLQVGSEVLILTVSGLYTMTSLINGSGYDSSNSITTKIKDLFSDVIATLNPALYNSCSMVSYPAEDALFVFVPFSTTHKVLVFNTIAKAWCTFSNFNANCAMSTKEGIYLFDGNKVYIGWNDFTDDGIQITATLKQAYGDYGLPGQIKRIAGTRSIFLGDQYFRPKLGYNVDFFDIDYAADAPPTPPAAIVYDSGVLYDSGAMYDTGAASNSELSTIDKWYNITHKPGTYMSLCLTVNSKSNRIKYITSIISLESGTWL